MKTTAILLLCFLAFCGKSFAQKDSLLLVVESEYKKEDSAKSYVFRIDFISRKVNPVEFYLAPLRPMNCCWDFDEETGMEFQRLDSNCYVDLGKCADCQMVITADSPTPYVIKQPETNKRTLKYGDTISYREDLPVFDSYGRNRKAIGFYGNYRCRAYRYYYEKAKRYKIYSQWLYINFPDYKRQRIAAGVRN